MDTLAVKPKFDKLQFKKSLLDRQATAVKSAREAIIGNPIITDLPQRALTERSTSKDKANEFVAQNQSGRIPSPKASFPTFKGALSEYRSEYCSRFEGEHSARKCLDECFNQTFNSPFVRLQTLVDISKIDRSQLRTALAGWGNACKTVYVPELRADSDRVHGHYRRLGLPHVFRGAAHDSKIPAPPSPLAPAPPGGGGVGGDWDAGITACTEYHGQFGKPGAGTGAVARTRHLRYRAVDFGPPDALEEAAEAVRRRRGGGTEALAGLSRYLAAARRGEALERHRAGLAAAPSPVAAGGAAGGGGGGTGATRIANIATLQKDLASPRGPGDGAGGGPCYLTGQRPGFLTARQSANPHHAVWTGGTRSHAAAHYCLIRG